MMKAKILSIALAGAVGFGVTTSANAILFGDPVTLNYTLSDSTAGSVTFDLLDLVDDRGYAEGFTVIDNNNDGIIDAADDNQFDFWLQDVTIGYKNNNIIQADSNLNTKYEITQVFHATERVLSATVDSNGAVTATFEVVTVHEYTLYFDDLTDGGAQANPNIVSNYTGDFVLLSSTSELNDGSAECPGVSSFTAFSTTAGRGEYSVCFDNLTGSATPAVATLTVPDAIQVDGQLDVPPSTIITQVYDGTLVSIGGDPTQEPGQNVLFNVDDDIQFSRVPEPSIIAALGLGLGILGFRNGFKRKANKV